MLMYIFLLSLTLFAGIVIGKLQSEGMNWYRISLIIFILNVVIIAAFAGVIDSIASVHWQKGATVTAKGMEDNKPYVELSRTMQDRAFISADKYIRLNIGDKF